MNKMQFLILSKSFYNAPEVFLNYSKEIRQKFDDKNKKLYALPVFKAYVKHNIKANEKAFEKVYQFFKNNELGNWKVVFENAYKSVGISSELKKTLKKATLLYYNYRKRYNMINYKKKAAETAYQLNLTDQNTINTLSKSDLLWIGNHATRTMVSTEIEWVIRDAIKRNLSGDAIAEELMNVMAGYEPQKYIEIFGEQRYWEMVTNTNLTRITAFNDLNVYNEIGYTAYKINTRGALACEICAPYSNKVYSLTPAIDKMNAYLDYAKREDTESMKGIFTFGESNPEGMGEVPPFHPNCYCELEPIQEAI